jgi:lipoprotein-releasing system permease protein
LCWRYLRTRYLALVCIVSVMLGVATLIVVNSVMGGFSAKLRERLHGLLSDVIVEAYDNHGFADAEGKMARIKADPFLAEHVEAMTPTLEIFGMIQYTYGDRPIARPVRIVGIDPVSRGEVGGFAQHLVFNKDNPRFEMSPEAQKHWQDRQNLRDILMQQPEPQGVPGEKPPPEPPPSKPFKAECAVVGYAIAVARRQNEEFPLLMPGDDVVITTISGEKLSPVYARYAVCDYFRSEMSEYDSQYVFVPLEHLQKLRTMEGRVTSIQIRLKPHTTLEQIREVKKRLQTLMGPNLQVITWEEKQGPLLAAISVEKGILNVLLFMIVGVAGFGILAIFSMIVVEKTRDIGIMKALGASNGGVMKIFIGYGLLLGMVGALFGTVMGLSITAYINEIEWALSRVTGQEIFPRDVYYFDRIPTEVQALHVTMVNAGAVAIAVLFSVLPALRAALLHPVRALRFE